MVNKIKHANLKISTLDEELHPSNHPKKATTTFLSSPLLSLRFIHPAKFYISPPFINLLLLLHLLHPNHTTLPFI